MARASSIPERCINLMDVIAIALILFIGSLTGFLSGFLGVGGGFILVPLLTFSGVSTHIAIGNSLAYIVFTGASGAIQHYKQKECNLKLVLLILCGGVIMAQIGAITTLYVEAEYLEILLGLLLLGTAVRVMITEKDRETVSSGNVTDIDMPIAIAIGLVTGFLSSLLGVGGGFLLTPLMVLALHIPIHVAIGTSLVGVIGLATSGAIGHWMVGHIDLSLVVILVVGGVISAPLGAKATKKFSPGQLRRIFCIILILSALILLIPIVSTLLKADY